MSGNESKTALTVSSLNEQILKLLRRKSGDYLSGNSVADHLAVSRSAVWKHVGELRKQGYEIEAHPHLGYRLISSPDLLYPEEVRSGLQTAIMGRRVLSYQRVRSTNVVALQMAQQAAPEGTLVIAEEQTAGRGRQGRIWHSPPGVGLWASLVLRPHIPPSRVFQLTICGALAVAETVYQTTHLPVKVKWPNDVLVKGKKLSGILTETQAELDSVRFVVLGLGINVNQRYEDFPEDLRPRATSIRVELGRSVSRVDLLGAVLLRFEKIYSLFQEHGLEPFLDRWRQLSWTLGRQVMVQIGERTFSGLAVDIEETGALVLEEASGERRRLLAGDVSFP
jgi:BirA family biotin operon repressor/biotin-[acetyl-CoA-carboxylase] ligase